MAHQVDPRDAPGRHRNCLGPHQVGWTAPGLMIPHPI